MLGTDDRDQIRDQIRDQSFAVVITQRGDGEVLGNKVLKAGDVVQFPAWQAQRRVREGTAEYTTRVRVLKADLSIGDRVCAVGDVASCAPDRAARLKADRLVEIVTP